MFAFSRSDLIINRKRGIWVNYSDHPSGELPLARFQRGVTASDVAKKTDRRKVWTNTRVGPVGDTAESNSEPLIRIDLKLDRA